MQHENAGPVSRACGLGIGGHRGSFHQVTITSSANATRHAAHPCYLLEEPPAHKRGRVSDLLTPDVSPVGLSDVRLTKRQDSPERGDHEALDYRSCPYGYPSSRTPDRL